jgi:very-short-patch-repair endonuclease
MPAPVHLRAEALRLLGGRVALDRALADGSWRRVLRGTYAPAEALDDLALRSRAAQRLLPEHAVVADRCLLWLLDIDVLPPGPPVLEVVLPRGSVVPRRAGVRARTAVLPPEDRMLLDPLEVPCLRPVRAAADLLRRLPRVEAVVVADAVQHAGPADADDLARELTAHAGLRGVRRAAQALELSDRRAESPPETRVRLALVEAGLAPVPQHVVRDQRGREVARVDLAFPAHRVAIEYDGRAVHERQDVFIRDRQRQNDLVRAGWLVLRFTAADLRGGAAGLAATVVAAALEARTAA